MEKQAKEKINQEIRIAKQAFSMNESAAYQNSMNKIYGMLDILTIYTGKHYQITENGLIEK